MTYTEAEDIIYEYEKWEDTSCTCFQGNPPCSKCENQLSEDDYENALHYIQDINETK